ncbi:MAG: lipocalin-like domain-containing protein [Gemmatimonadota bacterium]|nr:MAG: lipocalin-like domain-containing protein [Gemmatimonadota bacterium]
MKRSIAILPLLLFTISLATILVAADREPDPTGAQARFVGTWELVSIQSRGSDGEWGPYQGRFGPNAVGMAIFSASGYMSGQIMDPDRPTFSPDDLSQLTVEELRAILEGYTAYYGTYEVNEREGFVIHKRLGHLNPNRVVIEAKRFFEFAGDELTLTVAPTRDLRFTWRRVGS